jgi:hypothetical protein
MIKEFLTKFLGNILAVVMTIIVIFLIIDHFRQPRCPGRGEVIVRQSFLDSLRRVAMMPPTVIIHDSLIYKDKIVRVDNPVPQPYYSDFPINKYRDSLRNADVSVWAYLTVKGFIEDWKWEYQPVFRFQKIETYIPKPYPVTREIVKPWAGFWGQAGIGGADKLALSLEVGHINKQGRILSGQYVRYGDKNLWLVKTGFKF